MANKKIKAKTKKATGGMKKAGQQRIQQTQAAGADAQRLGEVEIAEPVEGGNYFIPAAGLCISGPTNADSVRLSVLLQAENHDPNATGVVQVVPVSQQYAAKVPYTGSDPAPPEVGAYKVVAWPEDNNGTIGTPVVRNFIRRPETETKTVSAKCCLWYAFASNGALGPYPEEDPVGPFAPVPVRIPLNAQSVNFAADPNDVWQHYYDVGSQADANGKANLSTDLENPQYRNSFLGSDVIKSIDTLCCKLVGLWKNPTAAVPYDYEQFAIGMGTSLQIPVFASLDGTLYLGMHDGKRWFNNSGNVDVTFTWAAPTQCPSP